MKSYIHSLLGWGVFVAAFATYASTVEPTASFWDPGEFISCAYKLQVPHPPGAPLFLLLGRLFSLLSFGDTTRVAFWINMLSVTASAFTILFLYKTVVLLGEKLLGKYRAAMSPGEAAGVYGAGVIGAMIYTFSDTFWFSAVETEVYALSSFFAALIFWAMFRWERIEDEATANRWLIFIAYLTGLSIGIHLLNLVTLPALTLIYYHRKARQTTWWGTGLALAAGFGLIGILNVGVIPGLPVAAFSVERLFVNSFGLPYNTGVLTFATVFLSAVVAGIIIAQKRQKPMLSTAILSLAFVLIGYFSYTQALVRSGFNPPINENDPSNTINFVNYLTREQYGSRPLLYGPQFSTRLVDIKRGEPMYKRENGRYVIYDYKPEYIWERGKEVVFPRMWSQQDGHPEMYAEETKIARDPVDESRYQVPTFAQNIRYFFRHQLGFMYARYFLWNFAGRESDNLWAGWLPDLSNNVPLPESIRTNKGHDNFYFLPLILGLFGFLYQLRKKDGDWLVLAVSFVMTGIALIVFLNSPPTEPRERDYIYVGSFYFFALWAGLGVLALQQWLLRATKKEIAAGVMACGLAAAAPGIMGYKSWDNHDRSNRYHTVDFARNMLSSCAPNAILFTGADNDSFPLWYVQEVEGFRKDVRVCCLSLLGLDWYIDQMKRKVNDSEPLLLSLQTDQYRRGINDYIDFQENPNVKDGIDLQDYLQLVRESNPAIQTPTPIGTVNILPSSVFSLRLDPAQIRKSGQVEPRFDPLLKDRMTWTFGKRSIRKDELIQLDIVAQNRFKRPIYFATTIGSGNYLGLKEFMQLEGYAYRLMPFRVEGAEDGFVHSDIMYKNMMGKMNWRGLDNPDVYYDETYRGVPIISARIAFLRLANQLLAEQQTDRARTVLNKSLDSIPDRSIPYDQISALYVSPLLRAGETAKALHVADTLIRRSDDNLRYYIETSGDQQEIRLNLYVMDQVIRQLRENHLEEKAKAYEVLFDRHYRRVTS